MGFATDAIHAGVRPDPATGSVMTPIYQTSTYVYESPGRHSGYDYARTINPTLRPGGKPQDPGGRPGRLRLRLRHGGDQRRDDPAEIRRPRGGQRQRVRRDLPAVRARPPGLRTDLHLRRHLDDRERRGGPAEEHAHGVHRDPHEPDHDSDRHRADRRALPGPRPHLGRGQHLSDAVPAASPGSRRGDCRAQHDQVPERSLRQRRRGRRAGA